MQQHEDAKRMGNTRGRYAGASRVAQCTPLWHEASHPHRPSVRRTKATSVPDDFQVRIKATQPPDFKRLHQQWNRQLQNARSRKAPTTPTPFTFDTEEEHEVRGGARPGILELELELELEPTPVRSCALRLQRTKAKEEAIRAKALAQQQAAHAPLRANPIPASVREASEAPRSKMTRAAALRMAEVWQVLGCSCAACVVSPAAALAMHHRPKSGLLSVRPRQSRLLQTRRRDVPQCGWPARRSSPWWRPWSDRGSPRSWRGKRSH